jgi:glycosyltransferase involved in cell wall biosynthesis
MIAPTILQLLPALDAGGVERGTVEIAEAIIGAGGRALVASEGGRLVPELVALGAEHVTLPLASKSPLRLWSNAGRIADLARQRGASLIHARSRGPAWSGWIAARRLGLPFVTTWHGTYSEGFPGKRAWNAVMGKGDRVIAISHFIAAQIEARGAASPSRIRVIPRGVDLRRFDPPSVDPARIAASRAAWEVPEGQQVILLPGRLTRWKGGLVAIEALARLGRPALLVLAGDAQGREGFVRELRARAAELGVATWLRLPGHVTDMPAALLAADLVLHTSIEPEAFGRVVTEAQAMARPIIAADAGAPVETVEEGVSGWRVPPGDTPALAAAIARVLAMPEEARRRVGEAARAGVPTLAAMQRATLDVYRELLAW